MRIYFIYIYQIMENCKYGETGSGMNVKLCRDIFSVSCYCMN